MGVPANDTLSDETPQILCSSPIEGLMVMGKRESTGLSRLMKGSLQSPDQLVSSCGSELTLSARLLCNSLFLVQWSLFRGEPSDCIWSACGSCTLVTIWLVQQITVGSRFLGEWEGERPENISWSGNSDAYLSSDITSALASTTSSRFSYSGNDYSGPSLKKALWSFLQSYACRSQGKILWKCLHWFLMG